MIDPKWLRSDPDRIRRSQAARGASVELVDELIAADEARCVALGAKVPEHQPGETWRVLLDPAGHPFCLTAAANWG